MAKYLIFSRYYKRKIRAYSLITVGLSMNNNYENGKDNIRAAGRRSAANAAFIALFSMLAISMLPQLSGAAVFLMGNLTSTHLDMGQQFTITSNVYSVLNKLNLTANWKISNSILGVSFTTPNAPVPVVDGYNTVNLTIQPLFPQALLATYNGVNFAVGPPPPNSIVGNWLLTLTVTNYAAGSTVTQFITNSIIIFPAINPLFSPIATTNSIAQGQSTTIDSQTVTGGSGTTSLNWLYSYNGGSMQPVSANPMFRIAGSNLVMNSNSVSASGVYGIEEKITDTGVSGPGFSVASQPAVVILHPGQLGGYNSANITLTPSNMPFQTGVYDIGQPSPPTISTIAIVNSIVPAGSADYLANVTWKSMPGQLGAEFFDGNTVEVQVPSATPNNAISLSVSAVTHNSIRIAINNNVFFANTPNPANNIFGTFTFNLIVTDGTPSAANVAFAVNSVTFGGPLSAPFGVQVSPTTFQFGNVVSVSANALGGTAPYMFKLSISNAITGAVFSPPGSPTHAFITSGPNFTLSTDRTPPMPPGTYRVNAIVVDGAGATVNTLLSAIITVPNLMFFNSSASNTAVTGNFTFYNRPEILNFGNTGAKINFTTTNNTIFSGHISIANGTSYALGVARPNNYGVYSATNLTLPSNYTLHENMTISYPCSLGSNVFPYELPSNNIWTELSSYSVNTLGCYVSVSNVPTDPIITLLGPQQSSGGGGGGGGSGSTTSTSTSTSSATTTSTTIPATTTVPLNITVPSNQSSYNGIVIAPGSSGSIGFINSNTIIVIKDNGTSNAVANVFIENDTGHITISPPANDPTPVSAINLTVNTSSNVTISVVMHYNCSYPSDSIAPFEQVNGTWVEVNPFSVNATACSVKFNVPKDPVFAVFSSYAPPTTTTAPTTASSTSTAQQAQSPSASGWTAAAVVIVIIIIIAAAYALMRRKR
jgi:hypothetical protein